MDSTLLNITLMVTQLLAIIDPLGVIPLLSLITKDSIDVINKVNRLVGIALPTLLVFFAIIGPPLFQLLHIKIHDLKIAGGIILLVIAIDILREGIPKTATISPEEFIFVPIITPMLIGPGAITAVMIFSITYPFWQVLLSLLIVSGITYMVIRYSQYILSKLGSNMLKLIARFMSLIIAAWAISLVMSGIEDFLKHLE